MSRNNTRGLILIPLSFAALYLALGDLSYSSSWLEAEWCHTDFPGSHFGSRNWQAFRSRVLLVLPGFLPESQGRLGGILARPD
ncbi:MAG TPA: hypothetical protein VI793_09450, partial [Anaerolineales bacterium]|nr:hypothetical protein [Anaerolineales bacterium]